MSPKRNISILGTRQLSDASGQMSLFVDGCIRPEAIQRVSEDRRIEA